MRNLVHTILLAGAVAGLAVTARAAAPTETLKNLQTAFAGESNAAHRYQMFADKADQDGCPQAAKLFRAASQSEQIHRDRHRAAITKLGGTVSEITFDEVKPGTTAENLKAAIAGESYERDTMYPQFIAQAKADDARAAVRSLQGAVAAEKEHAKLFQQALDTLDHEVAADYFVCQSCGFTVTAVPSRDCPVCSEPASKFKPVS